MHTFCVLTYLQVAAQSAHNIIHDVQTNTLVRSQHIMFHLHVHRISQPKKKVTLGEKTATILNFEYQSGLILQKEDKNIQLHKSCPQKLTALHVLN